MDAVSNAAPASGSRGLRIALWIAQVLLAAAFLMAGVFKAFLPIEGLSRNMAWVNAVPGGLVRFIGVAELTGGLGLVLPAATRILPILTPVAGAALALDMVLAASFHVSRGEVRAVPINLFLGAIGAFIAWGRFKKARIAGRA